MIRVEKQGRHFALNEGEELLALVCYRKGAERLRDHLMALRRRISELEAVLSNGNGRVHHAGPPRG